MPVPQPQYKDRLFNFLFGSEEHKDWTLSLYNAVNGTHYEDISLIEFTTIKEILYIGMHNDVSFLISDTMTLWEQQASYNPNMPLRFLQYLGQLYERSVVARKKNKFGKTLISLPVPKFVTFYNGLDRKDEEILLSLSDAFPPALRSSTDVDVRVRMINVNYGQNKNMLSACKPLEEYSWIVDSIRNLQNEMNVEKDKKLEAAIDKTIDLLPDDFVTKQYLDKHRAEVKGMLMTEYNEVQTMELFKEEGRAEGRKEGRAEGRKEGRAEGRKEGRAEGRKEGRAEGRKEGRSEGFSLFGALIRKLVEMGRSDEVIRVSEDPAYRDRLLQEFHMA